ncbi:hypothetical protein ACETU7_13400 [Rhodococcus sp. 3Y1]
MKSIEFITGLVLGGIATQFGPIVGATAVVFLPYYTGSVTDGPVSGVVFGAVLIAIVFLMPDGIVGRINSVLRRFVLVVPADHPSIAKVNPAPERRLPRPLSFLSTHSKELDDMKGRPRFPQSSPLRHYSFRPAEVTRRREQHVDLGRSSIGRRLQRSQWCRGADHRQTHGGWRGRRPARSPTRSAT